MDKSVSDELVRQVIEAGTFAPSAKNGQQWRFTVLRGEAKRGLTDVFRRELELVSKRISRAIWVLLLGLVELWRRLLL